MAKKSSSTFRNRVHKFLKKDPEGKFRIFLQQYPNTPSSSFYSAKKKWEEDQEEDHNKYEEETMDIPSRSAGKKSKSSGLGFGGLKINVGKDIAEEIDYLQWRICGLENGYFDRKAL